MSYTILSIRTADDDDGAIFPVIGADDQLVDFEPLDGQPQHLVASSVSVSQRTSAGLNSLGRFGDIKLDVWITEARVVVACKKWTKGGGWVGFGIAGVAVALTADAVSKARAARRRHGKLLMGQIRYAWLTEVGYHNKAGFRGTGERLRLGVVEQLTNGTSRSLVLDLTLPKDVNAANVAQAIVKAAARYRLAHTTIDSVEERSTFESLTDGYTAAPNSNPKNFTMFSLPSAHPVGRSTAYPQGESAT